MKEVPVTNSALPALVDDADFELVSQFSWYLHDGYAYSKGDYGAFFMHQLLTKQNGIDHKNRNRLDNQRTNFRPATHQQNLRNAVWLNIAKTSKFKGVSWDKFRQRWRACIVVNKRQTLLGRFKDEEKAAHAYNTAAEKLFGEFAVLNQIKHMQEHT